jgi:AbrB family looped-hinge helix DNA binding protein
MKRVATTKMSVKGQVVIPEEIRKRVGLNAGDRFVVVGEGDAVVLKRLRSPTMSEFQPLLQAAEQARATLTIMNVDRDQLAQLCGQNGIRRLALFGSATRGEATAESDLDVLVEFEEGKKPGLGFFSLERKLSQLFGSQVDLNTAEFLSAAYRDEVLRDAVELYAGP